MYTEMSKIKVLAKKVIKNSRFEPSKSTKNQSKTDANFYQFFDWFFDGLLVHVGPMLGPKIHLKSIKNQSKNNIKND